MIRKQPVSLFALALLIDASMAGILVVASPTMAQTGAEPKNGHLDPGTVDPSTGLLLTLPMRNPNWQPPPLPPGSTPAEQIGSFESRRDPEIDYPREARMAHTEGTTTVGVVIDKAGQVSSCGVVKSSGDAYLDIGSCALIAARGRYQAAHDAKGNPLISGVTLPIVWKLDWDVPHPPAESLVRLIFTMHQDGSFTDCRVDRGDGTQAVSHPEMCRGSWPPAMVEMFQRVMGSGDVRVVNVIGQALDDKAMAEQMAAPLGWTRVLAHAAWYVVDENGVASNCRQQAFEGSTEMEDDDPCRLPVPRFAPTIEDEKPIKTRVGTNMAYYVKLAEQRETPLSRAGRLPRFTPRNRAVTR